MSTLALSETKTASPNGSFTAGVLAAHLASLAHLPKWWLDLKREAWNRFIALLLPRRTDEFWRFSNTAGVQLDGYAGSAPEVSRRGHCPSAPRGAPPSWPSPITAPSSLRPLPADLAAHGVIFTSLEDALVKHADLVRRYFQAQAANLGADKFAALNAALTTSGAFLYVPRGIEIAAPFVATHVATGTGSAVFPHTIIVAEDHAKVTLVEFFLSAHEAKGFASGVNDLHTGDGAQLTYVAAQNWSRDTLSFQSNATTVQRDARVLSLNVHLGGRQSRHESHSRLQGPGAHSEMLALTIAQDAQEFDQRTLQTHQAPHTSSNLLYKNALLDQARTHFLRPHRRRSRRAEDRRLPEQPQPCAFARGRGQLAAPALKSRPTTSAARTAPPPATWTTNNCSISNRAASSPRPGPRAARLRLFRGSPRET